MKKTVYMLLTMIILAILSSSCGAMRKSRGGGWYRNRNNVSTKPCPSPPPSAECPKPSVVEPEP